MIFFQDPYLLLSAEREVRALVTINSNGYADAIASKNPYGGDTAEIYFSQYSSNIRPIIGVNQPNNDQTNNGQSNFNAWTEEILRVNEIVEKYGGSIEVEERNLSDFFKNNKPYCSLPRVHVKLVVEQDDLRLVKMIEESLGEE